MAQNKLIEYVDNTTADNNISRVYLSALIKKCGVESVPLFTIDRSIVSKKFLKAGNTIQDFPDILLKSLSERYDLVHKSKRNFSNYLQVFFASKNGVISCTLSNEKEKLVQIEVFGTFSIEKDVDQIHEILNLYTDKRDPDIYVLINSNSGLTTRSIGRPAKKLIKTNYNQEVLDKFDYVITEFNKDIPFGRMLILYGEPGTGKTNLIQGMLSKLDISNTKVIFLQPEYLTNFSVSNLMGILLESHMKRTLLIIEDGDELLVPRNDGVSVSNSMISKLLNIADGIVGNLLDLRLIITTNADSVKFDDAIKRPGRLCDSIYVGKLKPERANKAFKNITNQDGSFDKEVTLAEVYQEAQPKYKEKKIKPDLPSETKNKSRIGFN